MTKRYAYTAIDQSGREIMGEAESKSEIQLLNRLAGEGYMVSSLKERREGGFLLSLEALGYRRHRLGRMGLILFTRQMASLLSAGIPINTALRLFSQQSENEALVELTEGIKGDLEEGSTLSEAMWKRRDVFRDSYVSMVEAGEESGKLDEVFKKLAEVLEVENERREEIKSAVSYPVILIVASVIGVIFLLVAVFPTFIKIFGEAGVTLPWTTRLLVWLSHFIRDNMIIIAAGAVVSIAAARWYVNTDRGRLQFDRIKLKIPVVGNLLRKSAVATFAHMYRALLSSGVSTSRSLYIVSRTVGNAMFRQLIISIRGKIKEGATIAAPFRESGEFPPLVVHMLSVGEESGRMEDMLEKVSEYYEKEVSYAISRLTTMVEPVLIAVMGGVVALMYLSIISPMMQLMKVARAGGL